MEAATRICPAGTRVLVYVGGGYPKVPGMIVGHGFHTVTADPRMHVACIIQLDLPFDSPDGLYIRYLVLNPGQFEEVGT